MSDWLLQKLGDRVSVYATDQGLRVDLMGDGVIGDLASWPGDAIQAKRGRKAAFEISVAIDLDLATIEGNSVLISASQFDELRKAGLDLPGLWVEPAPFALFIESTSSLGYGDFAYKYRFFLGSREVDVERKGSYVRLVGQPTPYVLDPQSWALLNGMDHFNALPESLRKGTNAWLTFSEIKGCAKGVGAKLDEYLESNDVVVPPKIGVTIVEGQDGSISLIPGVEGLPDAPFERSFRRSREGQGLYSIDKADGNRIRVVFSEAQQSVLDRIRQTQKITGDLGQRIRKDPTIAFEGLLDLIEPKYARRVEAIGDWKSIPVPRIPISDKSLLDADGVDLDSVEAVDLNWPHFKGRIDTPVTLEAERADTHVRHHISLQTPKEAESFMTAMAKAHEAGESTFVYANVPLTVDNELLEILKQEDGDLRPQSKKYLLIYTDEEEIQEADLQEAQAAGEIESGIDLPYEAPKCLNANTPLKGHQEIGVQWLQNCVQQMPVRRGALLADEMGLGKTLEVLAFAAWCLEKNIFEGFNNSDGIYRPMLVVAPLMLVENATWQADMEKFFSGTPFGPVLSLTRDTIPLFRRASGRETDIGVPLLDLNRIRRFKVVITNYDTLVNYQHSFAQAQDGHSIWSLLVTDEAQKFKTPSTRVSHAIKALHPDFHIACTGTPVENRLLDLWNIIDAVQPALLGSATDFKRQYEAPVARNDGAEPLTRLRGHLRYRQPKAFLLRREKESVGGFPPKEHRTIPCEMTLYEVDRHIGLLKALQVADKGKGAHLSCLHQLISLYQHPRGIDLDFSDLPVDELLSGSSKLRATVDRLREIEQTGEKVIIFARHILIQEMLARVISKVFNTPVDVINGETGSGPSPAGSSGGRNHRATVLNRFRKREGFSALVLSPFVAGVGLTITEANHVIHYGRWWNPAVESQATDRVYRIGQERTVVVHFPILRDPSGRLPSTLDERLHNLLEKKRDLARDFLLPGEAEESLARELYDSLRSDVVGLSN